MGSSALGVVLVIIRAPRPQARFTQIRNDVLRDERLSYRSRGVLACLLSYPDDWRTDSVEIAKRGKEGREAVRTALRELEGVGYIIRDRVKAPQEHGFIWRPVVYVYDTPEAAAEAAADRAARRAGPPSDLTAVTSTEAGAEPGDGNLGAREPGAPGPRAPEKAAPFKDCPPNTEDEQNQRARAVEVDGQTTSAASGRARADDDPSSLLVRAEALAGPTSDEATLFESESSDADASGTPPDSASPPRSGPAGSEDPDFVRFWTTGPKRGARKAAYTAWRRARRGASVGAIEAGWTAHVAEWTNWAEVDRSFIPHASTWLSEARWNDPPEPRRTPSHLSTVPAGRRREDPTTQAHREAAELQADWEAGNVRPEDLFPKQARLAREAAARAGRRSA